MSTCRVNSSQRGFSIIEAIVVLLIASLVLSVVLPTVSRAVSDNLRIGMRGLDNFALSIAENSFRRLAAATVPPPTIPFEPPNLNTLSGDSTRAAFFVMANEAIPCAERGQLTEIRLSIEATQTGGRLICDAGEEAREIVQWEVGTASFGYSLDGRDWADAWPPAASAASGQAEEVTDLLAVPRRPSVVAPLLRFMISDTSTDRTPWVVLIGQPEVVEVRVEDLIGPIGAGRLP
jgi:prepilin-type N-terminal cleavage/methylation domain-containing protein